MNKIELQFDKFLSNSEAKTILINGVNWEYFVTGSGPKCLVVLTGGGSIAESAFMYVNAFSPTYKVITLTIPEVRTIGQCMDGIDTVLTQESIQKTSLLGFSMGGMIAQCFVRKYPEKVYKTVLFVSMLPSENYAKKYSKYRKGISLVPDFLFRWISKRSLKKQVLSEREKATPEVIDFWLKFFEWEFDSRKVTKQSLLTTTDILVDYFTNYEFTSDDLTNWQGDILLIESDQDTTVSKEERERFKEAYGKAEVFTQKGSGHFGDGLVNPENSIVAISQFLAK